MRRPRLAAREYRTVLDDLSAIPAAGPRATTFNAQVISCPADIASARAQSSSGRGPPGRPA